MLPKPGVRDLEQRHLRRARDDRVDVAAADELRALADAVVPVEHAVTTQMLWPIAPVSMAIIPDVESTRPLAMKVGATRSGPFSSRTSQFSIISVWPPAPVPYTTPMSSRFASVISSPESATACFAAATPYHMVGSLRRIAFASIHAPASKSRTSPAQRCE